MRKSRHSYAFCHTSDINIEYKGYLLIFNNKLDRDSYCMRTPVTHGKGYREEFTAQQFYDLSGLFPMRTVIVVFYDQKFDRIYTYNDKNTLVEHLAVTKYEYTTR